MDISEKKIEEIATQAKSQITVRSVGNGFDQPYETFISVGNITVSVRDLEDTPEDCTWQRDYQEIFYLGFHIGVTALLKSHITGKDGLLDVLEEVAEHYRTTLANLNSAYAALPPGPQRGQTQVNIEQMRPRLEKLEAHLSQWRQK